MSDSGRFPAVAPFAPFRPRRGRAVPLVMAWATPAGRVTDDLFEEVVGTIIDGLKRERPDGLLLALHGAMVTDSHPDADMEVLARLRAAAADAEIAQRAAAAAPEVAPIRSPRATGPVPVPEAPRPSSRFASMGVVEGVDAIDLDQALQRRRGA